MFNFLQEVTRVVPRHQQAVLETSQLLQQRADHHLQLKVPKVGQVTEVGQPHQLVVPGVGARGVGQDHQHKVEEVGVVPLLEVLEVGQQQVPGAGQVLMPVVGVGLVPQLVVTKVGQAEVGQGHEPEVGQDLVPLLAVQEVGQGQAQHHPREVDLGQDLLHQEVGQGRDRLLPEEAGQGQGPLHLEEIGQDQAQQHHEVGRGQGRRVGEEHHHTHHMGVVGVGQDHRQASEVGQPRLQALGAGLDPQAERGKVQRVMGKRKTVMMRKGRFFTIFAFDLTLVSLVLRSVAKMKLSSNFPSMQMYLVWKYFSSYQN